MPTASIAGQGKIEKVCSDADALSRPVTGAQERHTTWRQGYRVGRAGCGGALNGYVAPKRTQDWSDGETVRVGFLTLEVVAKVGSDYRLWNPKNGKQYTFTPHMGLSSGWDQ